MLKQLCNVGYAKYHEKSTEVGFNHINGIAVPELRVHVYTAHTHWLDIFLHFSYSLFNFSVPKMLLPEYKSINKISQLSQAEAVLIWFIKKALTN